MQKSFITVQEAQTQLQLHCEFEDLLIGETFVFEDVHPIGTLMVKTDSENGFALQGSAGFVEPEEGAAVRKVFVRLQYSWLPYPDQD